ncbi:MAG: hypothetical protein GOU99_00080 [Candidatus Altiarchaeota archaeon]|nr:hypothetical protein [Candidatus Altiarchaeota archaeon]
MGSYLIIIGLLILGYIVAYGLSKIYMKIMKLGDIGLFGGTHPISVIGDIVYFSMLFSVVFSGNLALIVLNISILLYLLYGDFGRREIPKMKKEDQVESKWFQGYP